MEVVSGLRIESKLTGAQEAQLLLWTLDGAEQAEIYFWCIAEGVGVKIPELGVLCCGPFSWKSWNHAWQFNAKNKPSWLTTSLGGAKIWFSDAPMLYDGNSARLRVKGLVHPETYSDYASLEDLKEWRRRNPRSIEAQG